MIGPKRTAGLFAVAVVVIVLQLSCMAAQKRTVTPVPQLFGSFQPVLGAWSEYSVTDTSKDRVTKMRMSIVGQDGQSYWYEVNQDDGGSRNIIKMLVAGNPHDPDNIQRLILKSGDNPAQEMPTEFVAMGRKMAVHMFEQRSGIPAGADTTGLTVQEIGVREVTVPAGTFKAQLRKIVDRSGRVLSTAYFDADVPPFGVISSETEQSKMALLGHGRDATTAITETPVVMTTPPGMPAGMPRGVPPGLHKQMVE